MQIRKDFDLREFVPPEIWRRFHGASRWFIDEDTLDLAQFIREYFGKRVTINNWHYGGDFRYRGFRPPGCDGGASLSQHKFGKAIDFNVSGLSPDEVREEIFANKSTFMNEGLTTLEDGEIADTWVHADLRNTGDDDIFVVKP